MTTDTLHPFAADYLQRLRRAGRHLPPSRLRELLTEIEGHLSDAIDPSGSDAQALTVLDRLGDPEAIIAAENPDMDVAPERHGVKEWAAITLLLLGGFILGIGWIAGVVLLWGSRAWSTREKWIGTLVIPGGLATTTLVGVVLLGTPTLTRCRGIVGGPQHCTSTPGPSIVPTSLGIAVVALLALASIMTSVCLTRRAAK